MAKDDGQQADQQDAQKTPTDGAAPASPANGPVTVKLGGKEYPLRYDLNALAYIGDQLGIQLRLSELGEDLLNQPLPLSALRTVLYAGVRHADDDLTEEDVGALVTQDNVQQVAEAFFGLFGVSLQDLSPAQGLGNGDVDVSVRAGHASR